LHQQFFQIAQRRRTTMDIKGLIGASAKFRALLEDVNLVAPVDSTVLIQGETGTGKELIARAIHEASPRRRNRLVALNCAAIPATLLENELFGSERGAFTGAVTQTIGRLQAADRGTLFLDEIGELPLELQPKLLRALQEKQFERLGGSRTIQVNVRVIAATNQDLRRMVHEGRFRADLYYRLKVFPITLPPLRERPDDIALLVEHFVETFARQQGKTIDMIPEEVMTALMRHDWPGNIRELQNVVERGVVMTAGRVLSRHTAMYLEPAITQPHCPVPMALKTVSIRTLADAERAHITAILHETKGVVGGPHGAAAQLGIPRTTLITRMQRLGISGSTTRSRLAQPMRGFEGVSEGILSGPRKDAADGLRVVELAAG
jgi:formate hydrogenlyase transcriptional activator